MGFLSFLSKNPRDRSSPDLRSQAYHATVQAKAPHRGTYPVAGNGPNMLDALQRSHGMVSDSQLISGDDSDVPPPTLPAHRFRNWDGDRPSSAPNGSVPLIRGDNVKGLAQRPTTKGPPVAFKKPKTEAALAPPPHLMHHSSHGSEPRVANQSGNELTVPRLSHSRHTSLLSMTSGKGFIDILDAQSEIKPSNFRSRVHAAGARDYGEDVADRNIGPTAATPSPEPARALTTPSVTRPSSQPKRSAPVVAASTPAAAPVPRAMGASVPRRPKTQLEPLEISPRAHSMTSASFQPFPKVATSFEPRDSGVPPPKKSAAQRDTDAAEARRRRRSIGSYVPSSTSTPATPVLPRQRPFSVYPTTTRYSDFGSPVRHTMDRPKTSHSPGLNELGIYATPLHAPSVKASRVVQKNKGKATSIPPPPPIPSQYQITERPKSAKASSRRSSTATAILSGPDRIPSKRHSMSSVIGPEHSRQPFARSEAGSSDFGAKPSRTNGERDSESFIGRVDVESATNKAGPSSPAPSPHVLRSMHSRSDSWDDPTSNYQRTRSLVSSSGKGGRLDEIYEHIPMRTSSLRHWSLSSSTAPSTSSSNPFGRPQSSHTANTSVDLAKFSSIMTSSRSSLDSRSGGFAGSPYKGLDSRLHSPLTSAGVYGHDGFNIDDYLSSDDDVDADSFVTPRPAERAVTEEALLFRDSGYGMGGLQLPGLFDAIPEVPSDNSPPKHEPHHLLRHSYRSPTRRAFSLDSRSFAPGYDYDEDRPSDEDDDLTVQADLVPTHRGAKRLSALGSTYGRIEEENLEKVDVRTAIRLRKEAKARKRASAHRKAKGKELAVVDLDEDHLADAEL